MRITKKERKENARKFYNTFMNSNCNQAAIVVEEPNSNNPNICRCRFLAVRSPFAFMEGPLVIAESGLGISGCFVNNPSLSWRACTFKPLHSGNTGPVLTSLSA